MKVMMMVVLLVVVVAMVMARITFPNALYITTPGHLLHGSRSIGSSGSSSGSYGTM